MLVLPAVYSMSPSQSWPFYNFISISLKKLSFIFLALFLPLWSFWVTEIVYSPVLGTESLIIENEFRG